MSELADLYAVQLSDIAIAQSKHRLSHLPEIASHDLAKGEVAAITKSQKEIAARGTAAKNEIATLEAAGQSNDATIARLNKQLKTVIAPREAEALQHEIATFGEQRSQLDERELELMELVELCEREEEQISQQLAHAQEVLASAAKTLSIAQQAESGALEILVQQRSAQSLVVPASLLSTYEAKRKHRPDGAIAKLNGPTCGACHLDIAQGEISALRALPSGELPECPHCGSFIFFEVGY
jgi:predicted  nucleic acid-binding Zn-ribbon protein